MTYNTIKDAVTMSNSGAGALLAGRYRVVRQLGQGGMGSVWLAEDTQLDNKLFAIKMLPSILVSNKRAYRQLKDEALVAMKLTHPNIVTLRAFEENDGNPFLVMDYVDGQTLDDYLVEEGNGERIPRAKRVAEGDALAGVGMGNGLSESEVLRLLKPIAAALDYAHGKGIVHRDVKPGNVMVAKDGTPYILDFGIAREIQETMTRVTGKLSSGTLLYMSPEQLNGDAPTKEQDIYSFAAMVYECLKGEPPFARGNIEFQIMNKAPEPLAGSGVSAAPLAVGIMAGLAKKPEDRPATCAAVLEGDGGVHVEHVKHAERAGGDGMTGVPSVVGSPSTWDLPLSNRKITCVWNKKTLRVVQILCAVLLVLGIAGGIYAADDRRPPVVSMALGAIGAYGLLLSQVLYHVTRQTEKKLQLFVAKNWYSAMQCFKRRLGALEWVSEHTDPVITFFQGVCFLEGLGGCKKDLLRARKLFTRSMGKGFLEAFCALGYMSQHGLGEDVNLNKARGYYSEAKNLGCKLAEKLLDGTTSAT